MAELQPRPAGALHDMELVARAATGDHAAFGELARRHVAAVRTLLQRLGADARQADALAQEAFLHAFERIADFHGEGAFAGWIKRIAARLYLKRACRGFRLQPTLENALATDDGAAAPTDLNDGLDAALATLPTPDRICVSLCFGAGLTQSEIAQALGAPLGVVRSHIARGVSRLQRSGGAVAIPPSRPSASW